MISAMEKIIEIKGMPMAAQEERDTRGERRVRSKEG